mgnify:CR=1 FL=1
MHHSKMISEQIPWIIFELTMALEDEYGIEIPSEDLEKIVTVGDVVEYVNAHKE